MEVNTSAECIGKMLHALPFADNERGLKETGELIRMLCDERAALLNAMDDLLDSPKGVVPKSAEAFYAERVGVFTINKDLY